MLFSITDGAELELPSSSQFYYFFDPVVDSGMSLSDLSMKFEVNALPNSSIHHHGTIKHTTTVQNFNPMSGLYSYGNNKGALDVLLLTEEYERLLEIAAENEKHIKEKEIILNMQDRELEAVIADIAQLCDLNATLTRNIRESRERRDYLKERARECRIEHLSYETGAIMLASENRELTSETEKGQHEIEEANNLNKNQEVNRDETLSYTANLETHIQLDRDDTKGKSKEKEKPFKYEYENLNTPAYFDDGEPCFEHLNKTGELQKGGIILMKRSPANDMFTYDRLSVISPNFNAEHNNAKKHHIEESTTSSSENTIEHFNVFGSRLFSSDCTLSTKPTELSNIDQEDCNCEQKSSLKNTKTTQIKLLL